MLLARDLADGIREDEIIKRSPNRKAHLPLGVADVVTGRNCAVVRRAHAISPLRPNIKRRRDGILPRIVRRNGEFGIRVRAGDAHFRARRIRT